MQHVQVVLRDEATDVCDAVRSRSVVQVLPLSWGQRGVLRSRGQYKRCIVLCERSMDSIGQYGGDRLVLERISGLQTVALATSVSQSYLEEGGRAHGPGDGSRCVPLQPCSTPRRRVVC